MKLHGLIVPAVLAVLALSTTVTAGDDAKAYTLSTQSRWKVGQALTRSEKDTQREGVKVRLPNGAILKDQDATTTTVYVRVEKCLEIDADGRWVKGLVHFPEWAQTVGEAKDETLKGVVIELSGAASARAWKTVSEGAAPSEAAKTWFDSAMGAASNADRMLEVVDPKRTIHVGESWIPDMAAFAEAAPKRLPLDVEKADCKVRLKSVDASIAVLEMDYTIPAKGVINPGSGALMGWTEGGVLRVKAGLTMPLTGPVGAQTGSFEYAVKGVALDPGSRATVTIDNGAHKEWTVKDGGEIPAVPAATPVPTPKPQ